MGDFDTADLLSDWDAVLARAGAVTASTSGVTFGGVWAPRGDTLAEFEDQLRDQRLFTIATTFTQLPTAPTVRQTVVRSGITYFVEAVRVDAEQACMDIDVKRVV